MKSEQLMNDLNGYTVKYFEEEVTTRGWRTPDRAPVSGSARTTFTLCVDPTDARTRPEGLTASDLRAIVAAMDATGAPDDAAVDVEIEPHDDGIPLFESARIWWVTKEKNR